MKLNDLELAHVVAAPPQPPDRFEPGRRHALASLKARLEKWWVGLYAAAPRKLPPMV
jgi:hypothetical protein